MKTCTKCGDTKPLNEFYANRAKSDGHMSQCKTCWKDYRASPRGKAAYVRWLTSDKGKAWWAQYNASEKGMATHAQYRASEAGRQTYRNASRRRRACKAGAEGNHTLAEFLALCEAVNFRCLACGEQKSLTEDHVVPLSSGGSDDILNIQPLCGLCNSRKGTEATDYRTMRVT